MKKYLALIIPFALSLTYACSESSEFELEKSVYKPDVSYPGLPAYSEWGYNTFGAFYDRKVFIYTDEEVPAKVINHDGITRLVLKGVQGTVDFNSSYYYDSYPYYRSEMSMTFCLPDILPENYTDLTALHQQVINLIAPGVEVITTENADTVDMEVLRGELNFKRVQHLYVDNQSDRVILSGTFSFQALVSGEPISVSYGRFDVGIGETNFFAY